MNDSGYTLEQFLGDCRSHVRGCATPADCVERLTPFMSRLLNGDKSFLEPEHFRSDPEHYARNLIYLDPTGTLSLYALVWLPGQWTPIHDHGTWGVVGVLEGTLEERNYVRLDSPKRALASQARLTRGGMILLSPGTVTSFVPDPDHIHMTGNSHPTDRTVSLHLYGHAMAGFHTYDLAAGTRSWLEVEAYTD